MNIIETYGKNNPGCLYSKCRIAFICDGIEGYAPWRPIDVYPLLVVAARKLMEGGNAAHVKAWVERR